MGFKEFSFSVNIFIIPDVSSGRSSNDIIIVKFFFVFIIDDIPFKKSTSNIFSNEIENDKNKIIKFFILFF